jgi:hypothetical protein
MSAGTWLIVWKCCNINYIMFKLLIERQPRRQYVPTLSEPIISWSVLVSVWFMGWLSEFMLPIAYKEFLLLVLQWTNWVSTCLVWRNYNQAASLTLSEIIHCDCHRWCSRTSSKCTHSFKFWAGAGSVAALQKSLRKLQ